MWGLSGRYCSSCPLILFTVLFVEPVWFFHTAIWNCDNFSTNGKSPLWRHYVKKYDVIKWGDNCTLTPFLRNGHICPGTWTLQWAERLCLSITQRHRPSLFTLTIAVGRACRKVIACWVTIIPLDYWKLNFYFIISEWMAESVCSSADDWTMCHRCIFCNLRQQKETEPSH